jgi:hypothetical protein
MKRHWLILSLLLLAHLALDLVAWRLAAHQRVGSPAQILLIVLLRTQLSLLALYVALGTGHWAVRLAGITTAVALWTGAFLRSEYANLGPAQLATLFTLLVLPVVLIGAAARALGYRWGQPPERLPGGLAARQFSLGAAFRWLTLSALLLGLAKQADFPLEYGELWLRVSLINTFVAMAFLWAVATEGKQLPKIASMVAVAFFSTLLLQDNPQQAWVTKFVLQALLMAGTAEVCRIAGWPLGKSEVPNDE